MIKTPNIFSLATKELSQDAFIAWSMQWACSDLADSNPELHAYGKDLVQAILRAGGVKVDEVSKLEAGLQWKRVDIWAEVNDAYLIIIEDKTYSSARGDQLRRYKQMAERHLEWERTKAVPKREMTLVPIYLKIAEECQETLDQVRTEDYSLFTRQAFLDVLNRHTHITNQIFADFKNHLGRIEKEHDWQHIPLEKWSKHTWMAFYKQLEADKVCLKWHKVNNPSGGFQNALLSYNCLDGYPLYIQIEQDSLAFKVKGKRDYGEEKKDADLPFLNSTDKMTLLTTTRDWLLNQKGATLAPWHLHKTQRRTGKWMTIARVDAEHWLRDINQTIAYPVVKERLEKYKRYLEMALLDAEKGEFKLEIR